MGVSLADLTFIEDGHADFLQTPTGAPPTTKIVNFDKRRKIARSIAEIKLYQQEHYLLHDIVEIQAFISNARGLDERVLLKRSLERMSCMWPRWGAPAAGRRRGCALTGDATRANGRGIVSNPTVVPREVASDPVVSPTS